MSFLRQGRTSNKTFYQNVKVISAHNTNFKALQISYGHPKRFKGMSGKRIETN